MNRNMSSHNKDLLLQVLMHYLPMDIRSKVIQEVPAAYNDFYGEEITRVTTDTPIKPSAEGIKAIGRKIGKAVALDLIKANGDMTWPGLSVLDGDIAVYAGIKPCTDEWATMSKAAQEAFEMAVKS